VSLDRRSVADVGCVLELRDGRGRPLSFGGAIGTASDDDDHECEWFAGGKDVVAVADDTVVYRFEAAAGARNDRALWGFEITAWATHMKDGDRAVRTASYLQLVERKVS
jgi:hypothetical protein